MKLFILLINIIFLENSEIIKILSTNISTQETYKTLINYEITLTENINNNKIENSFPIEIVNILNNIKDFKTVEVRYGYGSGLNIIDNKYDLDLPNGGYLLITNCKDKKDRIIISKLISSLIQSENDIVNNNPDFKFYTLENEVYYTYNSALNYLCVNNIKALKKWLPCNGNLGLLGIIDSTELFRSEYIGLKIKIEKKQNLYQIKINLIFEFKNKILKFFLIETNPIKYCYIYDKIELENKNTKTNLLENKDLNSMNLKTIFGKSKRLKQIKNLSIYDINKKDLEVKQFFVNPFYYQNNILINNFRNYSENDLKIKINIIFTFSEIPIFSKIKFNNNKKFNIEYEKINILLNNYLNNYLITIDFTLNSLENINLEIPFRIILRNHELHDLDKTRGIYIPPSTINYINENTLISKYIYLNNLNYFAQNYDDSMIFTVMTVYLLIIFFIVKMFIKVDLTIIFNL